MFRPRRATFHPLVDRLDERCLLSTGLTPAQIQTAYGLSNTNNGKPAGSGETIAIVDAYNDPNINQELSTFDSAYKLAAANLTVVNENGSTSSLPSTDSGWAVEEALDVEWAHALAPGASIVLVEASSQSLSDLMKAVETAATPKGAGGLGANVVSMSWGINESGLSRSQISQITQQYDTFFAKYDSSVTFVAASGDSGGSNMPGGGAEWPSSSPYVLAVGGTTLTINGQTGTYASETAWIDSSGGTSSFEPEPSYQFKVQQTGKRDTPDVSFDADPNSGVAVYSMANHGGWEVVGGTSVGSPSWAAIVASLDQQAGKSLGTAQVLNGLYSIPSTDFNTVAVNTTPVNNGFGGRFGRFPIFGNPTPTPTPTSSTFNTSTGLGSPKAGSTFFSDLLKADTNIVITTTTTPPPAPTPTPTPSSTKSTTTSGSGSTTSTTNGGTTTGQNGPTGRFPIPWAPGSGFFGSRSARYSFVKATSTRYIW